MSYFTAEMFGCRCPVSLVIETGWHRFNCEGSKAAELANANRDAEIEALRIKHGSAMIECTRSLKEIEVLRTENEKLRRGWNEASERNIPLHTERIAVSADNARLREALELIAAPKRSDGTYNRCREACEQLAKKALEGK